MAATLTMFDETTSGTRTPVFTLPAPTPTITARELIRVRIFEELRRQDRQREAVFRTLVEWQGSAAKPASRPDFQEQVEIALAAFERNGFLLLVGDKQVDSLDEPVPVGEGIEVTFLKLVPLVGG